MRGSIAVSSATTGRARAAGRWQLLLGIRPDWDVDNVGPIGAVGRLGDGTFCYDALTDPDLALSVLEIVSPGQTATTVRPITAEQRRCILPGLGLPRAEVRDLAHAAEHPASGSRVVVGDRRGGPLSGAERWISGLPVPGRVKARLLGRCCTRRRNSRTGVGDARRRGAFRAQGRECCDRDEHDRGEKAHRWSNLPGRRPLRP